MNAILANPVVEVLLAVLIYPGVLVALIVAAILAWVRGTAAGVLQSGSRATSVGGRGGGFGELRALWRAPTTLPEGVYSALLTACTLAALIFPLLALILLPVPGNPLALTLGLGGDLIAGAALLLGVPLVRLLLGWAATASGARAAADRGARLLAGAALPMGLAVAAVAEETATLRLDTPPLGVSLPLISLIARILAALAFACVLPVLAQGMARGLARSGDGEAATSLPDELAQFSGRDALLLRVGEAVQLVAATAFFIAAFVLPVLAAVTAPLARGVIWVVGLLVVAAAIGLWQGSLVGRARPETEAERPPLTWWLGLPVLLALAALVAAAWAARVG